MKVTLKSKLLVFFAAFVALTILLNPAQSLASALHNAIPHEEIITYTYRDDSTIKEAAIKGIRYLNPKTGEPNTHGKKILLTHGFMSTPHEFDHMVDYFLLGEKHRSPLSQLITEGFDIYTFAFRGHGIGIHGDEASRRSYVINYQDGDYQFKNEFKDFHAMLKYIDNTAKNEGVKNAKDRKISVIGHSMGGMVSTAATATNPRLRKYIEVLINIQSPNDFITAYDDREVGVITPQMGQRLYQWLLASDKDFPLIAPSTHNGSIMEVLRKFLFSKPVEKIAHLTKIGRKFLDMAKFGIKSGGAVHRDLLLDMIGFGVNNNYPYVGLDPKVPVVNLYGGKDSIAPKNSIIEQSKAIYGNGGKVWTLEIETAGHLDVVFPSHLKTYMPYLMVALKDPYLLGEVGAHIRVEKHYDHYVPYHACTALLK